MLNDCDVSNDSDDDSDNFQPDVPESRFYQMLLEGTQCKKDQTEGGLFESNRELLEKPPQLRETSLVLESCNLDSEQEIEVT